MHLIDQLYHVYLLTANKKYAVENFANEGAVCGYLHVAFPESVPYFGSSINNK